MRLQYVESQTILARTESWCRAEVLEKNAEYRAELAFIRLGNSDANLSQQQTQANVHQIQTQSLLVPQPQAPSDAESFRLVYSLNADGPTAEIAENFNDGSEAESDPWSLLDSAQTAATRMSWVSAPARFGAPRCFLPRTRFLRPSGRHVTAAELRGSGMDVVMGPGGQEVKVIHVVKHPSEERTMVSIQADEASHRFTVTGDHLLVVEGSAGERKE